MTLRKVKQQLLELEETPQIVVKSGIGYVDRYWRSTFGSGFRLEAGVGVVRCQLKQPNTRLLACVLPSCFSRVWLFVMLWAVAHRANLSMESLQARILEWVAMPSSRRSSWPRDRTHHCVRLLLSRWILYPLSHIGSSNFLPALV